MFSCSRQCHPATIGYTSMISTVKRMDRLHELVSCSPTVLWQYNVIRGNEIFQLFPKAVNLLDKYMFHDTIEPTDNPTEEMHFFSAVSTLTDIPTMYELDDTGSYFFDPNMSLSDLSSISMSLDYYDCPGLEDDHTLFTDWMDLDEFNENTYIDCSREPMHSTIPSLENCPTPLAYNALTRGGIPRSFDDCVGLGDLFAIIVDSGASLSISPHKSDFIGPIQPVNLRLGGMADGMIIEGRGKVEWSFKTQNGKTLTIKTLCYYVPDCKARLLSP